MPEFNPLGLDLKLNLPGPCRECPFAGKMPGWLSEAETVDEYIDNARFDVPYPCHLCESSQCAGQMLFMNAICKRSRDPERAAYQKSLAGKEGLIVGGRFGDDLRELHARGPHPEEP